MGGHRYEERVHGRDVGVRKRDSGRVGVGDKIEIALGLAGLGLASGKGRLCVCLVSVMRV